PRHPPNALLALDPKHPVSRPGASALSAFSNLVQLQVLRPPSQGFLQSPTRRKDPRSQNCIRSTMSNNRRSILRSIGKLMRLSQRRLSQGTASPIEVVEPIGIEPTTSSLQS